MSPIVSTDPLAIVTVLLLPALLSVANWLLLLSVRFALARFFVSCKSTPWASPEKTFVADSAKVPEFTVTSPVSVLAALMVTVPVPSMLRPPEPVIVEEIALPVLGLPVTVT